MSKNYKKMVGNITVTNSHGAGAGTVELELVPDGWSTFPWKAVGGLPELAWKSENGLVELDPDRAEDLIYEAEQQISAFLEKPENRIGEVTIWANEEGGGQVEILLDDLSWDTFDWIDNGELTDRAKLDLVELGCDDHENVRGAAESKIQEEICAYIADDDGAEYDDTEEELSDEDEEVEQ